MSLIFIFLLVNCSSITDSEISLSPLIQFIDYNNLNLEGTFFFNYDEIVTLKIKAEEGDEAAINAIKSILLKADYYLTIEAPTVASKDKVTPSDDIHDYVSLAPYRWPELNSTTNSIEYVRRDGVINPEVNKYDIDELLELKDAVLLLSSAYYITNKKVYAEKAVHFIEVWFINPSTKMNPNLNYAQFVPGLHDGKPSGIIEGINLARILDGIFLLKDSNELSWKTKRKLKEWYLEYYEWLKSSELGIRAKAYKNNQGSWYDLQLIIYSQFLGLNTESKTILSEYYTTRIADQIAVDGRQINETYRTNSLSYSVFNLEALLITAEIASKNNIDIWNQPTVERSVLRSAVLYLSEHIVYGKDWKYQQIKDFDTCRFLNILKASYKLSTDPIFLEQKNILFLNGCNDTIYQIINLVEQTN